MSRIVLSDPKSRANRKDVADFAPLAWAMTVVACLFFVSSQLSIAIAVFILTLFAITSRAGGYVLFLIGGVFLFDSGQSPLIKGPYVALVAVLFVIALVRIRGEASYDNQYPGRGLVRAGSLYAGLAVFILIPLGVLFGETTVEAAVRTAAPFLMVPVGIVLALDAGRGLSSSSIYGLAWIVGILSSGLYALTWLQRRDVIAGTQYYFLGSRQILAASFLLGFGMLVRRLLGSTLASLLATSSLGAAVLSGNRTSLLMVVGVLPMLVARGNNLGRALRGVGAMVAIGLLSFALYTFVLPLTGLSSFVNSRATSMERLLSEGVASDASGLSRIYITDRAMQRFWENPLIGQGLGSSGQVDSPALYLQELGVLGTGGLAIVVFLVMRSLLRLTAGKDLAPVTSGWILAFLLSIVSAMPTADPGLAISISLLTLCSVGEKNRSHLDVDEATYRRDSSYD